MKISHIYWMDIFIGVNIKYLRKLKKMSQTELGNYLGITMGAVSNIEHGRHTPSVTVLVSLVQLFNCNLHDLFFSNMSAPETKVTLKNGDYNNQDRISARLEYMLTDLEDRIRRECPECAKKIGL